MSANDWTKFAEDLERAAGLAGEERARFLDQVCAGEPRRRARLERLLAADERAGAFLSAPVVAPSATPRTFPAPLTSVAGDVVARYTIVRCVGRGGIGTVYEAEQENPQRSVALKLLDPSLATGAALQRFRFEALVLGRLSHPGIATVHEAGEDEHGRVYLAMELVKDATFVTDHVARRNLTTDQRLSLFLELCAAVAYAHERGVIHRDLKPSNVLVDDSGHIKVIDFGIARALDNDAARLTRDGDVVGTLAYMSPEQVSGRTADVGVRSDVYALGALLYELLSGRRARDLTGVSLPEVFRRIREDAPTSLTTERPDLPRELAWITSKALHLDAAHRYASVPELVDDLDRLQRHLPVRAGPPTASYRIAKFARRHRVAATIGATLALLLVGALVAGIIAEKRALALAARRMNAERVAVELASDLERELSTNREIVALQTGWLGTILLDRNGSDVRVLDVLDAAARDLDDREFPSREVEAGTRQALAMAYASTGLVTGADAQLEHLRRIAASGVDVAPENLERIELVSCRALAESGEWTKAIELARAAVDERTAHHGPSAPSTVAWSALLEELLQRNAGRSTAD